MMTKSMRILTLTMMVAAAGVAVVVMTAIDFILTQMFYFITIVLLC